MYKRENYYEKDHVYPPPPERALKQSSRLLIIALAAIIAFTFLACDEEGGGGGGSSNNTEPKVLVINNIDETFEEYLITFGIFPKGTSFTDAYIWEGIVALGSHPEKSEVVDGKFSLTVDLIDALDYESAWKGYGAYDVFLFVVDVIEDKKYFVLRNQNFNKKPPLTVSYASFKTQEQEESESLCQYCGEANADCITTKYGFSTPVCNIPLVDVTAYGDSGYLVTDDNVVQVANPKDIDTGYGFSIPLEDLTGIATITVNYVSTAAGKVTVKQGDGWKDLDASGGNENRHYKDVNEGFNSFVIDVADFVLTAAGGYTDSATLADVTTLFFQINNHELEEDTNFSDGMYFNLVISDVVIE